MEKIGFSSASNWKASENLQLFVLGYHYNPSPNHIVINVIESKDFSNITIFVQNAEANVEEVWKSVSLDENTVALIKFDIITASGMRS